MRANIYKSNKLAETLIMMCGLSVIIVGQIWLSLKHFAKDDLIYWAGSSFVFSFLLHYLCEIFLKTNRSRVDMFRPIEGDSFVPISQILAFRRTLKTSFALLSVLIFVALGLYQFRNDILLNKFNSTYAMWCTFFGHGLYWLIARPLINKFAVENDRHGNPFAGWKLELYEDGLKFEMKAIIIGGKKAPVFFISLKDISDFRIFASQQEAELFEKTSAGRLAVQTADRISDQINFLQGKIVRPEYIHDSPREGQPSVLLQGLDFLYMMNICPSSKVSLFSAYEYWCQSIRKSS